MTLDPFREGMAKFQAGQYEDAISLFILTLGTNDQNSKAWNAIGVTYVKIEQFKEAAGAFQRAVSLEPDNEHYKKNLTINAKRVKEEAKKVARKEQKAGSGSDLEAQELYKLGIKAVKDTQYRSAVSYLTEYIKQDKKNPKAWNALGIAYQGYEYYLKAHQCFENACRLDPANPTFKKNQSVVQKKIDGLQGKVGLTHKDELTRVLKFKGPYWKTGVKVIILMVFILGISIYIPAYYLSYTETRTYNSLNTYGVQIPEIPVISSYIQELRDYLIDGYYSAAAPSREDLNKIKGNSVQISYLDLLISPDNHISKQISFTGKVIRANNSNHKMKSLICVTTLDESEKDPILVPMVVNYRGDNKVYSGLYTFYGTYEGLQKIPAPIQSPEIPTIRLILAEPNANYSKNIENMIQQSSPSDATDSLFHTLTEVTKQVYDTEDTKLIQDITLNRISETNAIMQTFS